jgi:acyl-CoA synthetase (AMP-forming)/AMP-acid ligase II
MWVESFLEQTSARLPTKIGMVCGQTCLSYGVMEQKANRLANGLRQAGLCRGDRTVIYLDAIGQAVISLSATCKAGGVFANLHPTAKSNRLKYIFDNSDASVLVTDSRKPDRCRDILRKYATLNSIVVTSLLPPNLAEEQVERVFEDIRSKRVKTIYGHMEPLLARPVDAVKDTQGIALRPL